MRDVRKEHDEIRTSVWLGAIAVIALALVSLLGSRPISVSALGTHASGDFDPAIAPEPAVSEVAGGAPAETQAVARPPDDRRISRAAARASIDALHFAETALASSPIDSRLTADLRVLETEAAQRFESIFDFDAAADVAWRDPDAWRLARSDQVLIDLLVQDEWRGTVFPIGYPARERSYEVAASRVAGYGAQLRRDALEAALATEPAERIAAPRFESPASGLVWEGASR